MKHRIATTLMLAMLTGSPAAIGQSPPPNAGTAAQVAAPAQAPARASAEANRASAADARNCLGFSTNLEVIKCAEKYLYRRPKG